MAVATRRGEPRFVGRESEIAALTRALTLDAHTSGRVIVVSGEPGIGKSALISAALARAGAATGPVLRATADAMDQRRPHGLLLDALASADAETRERVAALESRQQDTVAVDSARSDVMVGEHLLDLIDVLAARGPFTLVLEDLQWADAASLTLLSRLCRTLRQLPVALIVSRRPLPRLAELEVLMTEADHRDALTVVDLGPLAPEACAVLTEAMMRARPSNTLLQQMAAAGGNPLFLIEMVGVIQRDGSLTVAPDGTASLAAPRTRRPSLALMIMHHLAALSTPARELLVLASVLGARFPIADLRLISGLSVTELLPALTEVITAGVLGEDGDSILTFRHALIQEVLNADIPAAIRGELHYEVAKRLEAVGGPPISVAEHLLRAPAMAQSIPWMLEVAERVRPSSSETAVELWRHVMAASSPGDHGHMRAAAGIARAAMIAGRTAEAAALARDVLAAGTPAELESGVRSTLSHALLYGGDLSGAQDEADRAAHSTRLSPAERATHLAFAGWPPLMLGATREALARAYTAEDAAVASGNVPARVGAMLLHGHIAACRGDLGAAIKVLMEAVEIAEAERSVAAIEPLPHQIAATVLADLDRVPESLALFERGRRLAESLGYLPGVSAAFYLCAGARALSGHLSDVEADLEARESLRSALDVQMEVPILGTRAWLALHRDGPDAAEPWIRRLGDLDGTGLARGLAWVYGPVSAHTLATGDKGRAFRILWQGWERCVAREMVMDCVHIGVDLAALAMHIGEPEHAAEVSRAITAVADANPTVLHLSATAHVIRGLVAGDGQQVLAGASLLAATPRRLAHGQASELASLALAVDGQPDAAITAGEAALRSYVEIGADHDVTRARVRLGLAGVHLKGPRASARPSTGWAALTRTEETVARQVATGLSNPEVAEILFVSRRTVESHVSHILAKLALRSRTELVLLVARRADHFDEHRH